MKKTRVLILGGGFGGLYAALEFEKRRDPDFEITLVSQENFFLFTPMVHEVALPYHPNLKPEMLRVILVHPGDFVLPELGEELGRYASRKLAERGVEIRPNTRVKAVTSRDVELTDGTRIDSFTLVWTAGISPHPLLNQLDLPKKRSTIGGMLFAPMSLLSFWSIVSLLSIILLRLFFQMGRFLTRNLTENRIAAVLEKKRC
jgi:NADH dehydrogenase FAD-containing subunit